MINWLNLIGALFSLCTIFWLTVSLGQAHKDRSELHERYMTLMQRFAQSQQERLEFFMRLQKYETPPESAVEAIVVELKKDMNRGS